jgi:hypothetical protein
MKIRIKSPRTKDENEDEDGKEKSAAAIDTLCGTGFGDDDFGQVRELGFQLFPDPDGHIFARWIFQAGNFVEVMVVELFPERLEGGGDVGVIHEPAEFGIALAGDDDFRRETVAVEAAAFVGLRQMRQQMGGFELEGFAQLNVHKVRLVRDQSR